jgi:hypothetical protein
VSRRDAEPRASPAPRSRNAAQRQIELEPRCELAFLRKPHRDLDLPSLEEARSRGARLALERRELARKSHTHLEVTRIHGAHLGGEPLRAVGAAEARHRAAHAPAGPLAHRANPRLTSSA